MNKNQPEINNLLQLIKRFPTEESCRSFLSNPAGAINPFVFIAGRLKKSIGFKMENFLSALNAEDHSL